jgi:hypothetical protein
MRLSHRNAKILTKYLRDLCVSVVHIFLFSAFLIFLLSACEPEPTPFPVDIPPTPSPTPDVQMPIRYAFAPNTSEAVSDLDLIAASGSVEHLIEAPNPADIGTRFDVIAAYGKWPDTTESPILTRVALVINSSIVPLDAPAIANVLRRALDPTAILADLDIPGGEIASIETASPITLRTELANAGWPDGFDVIMASESLPGITEITGQLAAISVAAQPVPLSNSVWERTHLAIIAWTTPEERAAWIERAGGESNVIDLFTLPISYWAAPDLSITFTPGGWPLATRS